MKLFTRKRAVVIVAVVAFVAAISIIGAVSRSSPSATTASSTAGASTGGTAPSVLWYWTMAVSPSDPNALVLGTSNGLYRSSDGGKTWAPTGPKDVNATSVVQVGSTLLAGGAKLASGAGPVIKKGSARAAADGASVLASSTDGGKTWKLLHPGGLPNFAVQALAVDPVKDTTLYALLNTGALFRSTDGGGSFSLVTSKLKIPPWALAITDNSHFVGGDMDAGPHTSSNGTAWQPTRFTDPRGSHMVMEYAVQPTDAARILMTSYGVEESTDGGQTWHPALKSDVMFGPVAWAAKSSTTAYAVGFDGSVWHTSDGGKTWAKVG